jgi:predicted RNA-binding protein YlxR (DUF448 family)
VAIRTCLVCGGKKPKAALLRVALDRKLKQIVLDRRQHMEGRGAYVCHECLPRLRFNKRVEKAFRNEAKGLSEDILQQLPTR